jgi:DNA repair exonuclease SbcCD ATPase subunit
MSRSVLTLEEVEKALTTLRQKEGREPSTRALHAAVGNRGSMTTLLKMKRDLDKPPGVAPGADPEQVAQFNALWAAAKTVGRAEREEEVRRLQEELDTVMAEAERMEGEIVEARQQGAEIAAVRDRLIAENAAAHQELTAARAAGEQQTQKTAAALERLSTLQAAHAQELSALGEQLRQAEKSQHETALSQARTEGQLAQATTALGLARSQIEELQVRLSAEHAADRLTRPSK